MLFLSTVILVVDYFDVLIRLHCIFRGLLFSKTVVYVRVLAVALYFSTILRIKEDFEENESLVSRITWPVGFRRTEGQTSCNPKRL